jgi:murein DD-endopeptidase MepM/ murein hydrolase activator NlpD
LERFVNATFEKYLQQKAVIEGVAPKAFEPDNDAVELWKRGKILLSEYQPMVEKAAHELFSRPQASRLWDSKFFYPGGSPKDPRFASSIRFTLDGEVLGSFESPGVFFVQKAGGAVRAVEAGRVIFADYFGLLGNTVVLDHGFGISTFYSNLSTSQVVEGDNVNKGQTLGLAGRNLLLQQEGCLFQTRLFGYPVRPEEWWDKSWIESRILKQIASVRKELGLASRQPLSR